MRALELRGDKGIDSIVYTTERPIPVPENDEILVQVKAVGLNPVDYQIAEGFGDVNLDEPVVLGLDVAGIGSIIGVFVILRALPLKNLNRVIGYFIMEILRRQTEGLQSTLARHRAQRQNCLKASISCRLLRFRVRVLQPTRP